MWTAEHIYPSLSDEYRTIRKALKKTESPLNVIVTHSGEIDTSLPVFQSGQVRTLIITTRRGAYSISHGRISSSVHLVQATGNRRLCAREIIDAVAEECGNTSSLILVEGGPLLLADFFAERVLDEQFLTLAPQVAGRDGTARRPGLVDGKILAPQSPVWGSLIGVKRGGDHLFLRYAFERNPTI